MSHPPSWRELVERLPDVAHPLRALVVGDANAEVCRELADAGWAVACCPDAQRGHGPGEHVDHRFGRLRDVAASTAAVDAVVVTQGWRRLLQTNRPAVLHGLFEWARGTAAVTVVEAPRRQLAADADDFGPFDVLRILGGFRFLAEAPSAPSAARSTPILLASDRFLLAVDEWVPARDVDRLDEEPAEGPLRPVRTFRVPGPRIVKVECTSEDYFERTQLLGEAAFLGAADPAMRAELGLPLVLAVAQGRAVTTLVREDVAGGVPPAVGRQLAGAVDAAVRYAALGLFHNDFRPWNLQWHGDRARLVDFSETSTFDDDVRDLPQVLALAGSLAAIATDEIRPGESFHTDVLDLADRAGLLDRFPLEHQLTAPWLALPGRRDRLVVRAGMSAEQIMAAVLEATHGR